MFWRRLVLSSLYNHFKHCKKYFTQSFAKFYAKFRRVKSHIVNSLRNPAYRQAGLRFISEPLRENKKYFLVNPTGERY